jgi:thymidylate synthase ThyX
MIIKLAGFNVDVENISILHDTLKKTKLTKKDISKLLDLKWTPETISASYARISRDPRTIDELREDARNELDKARKSNKAIIFDMGHSSIAEHGVFNIDVINITRLAAERLERSRLASFTEKSQRYIKIGYDYLEPVEFKENGDFLKKYNALIKELFDAYHILHDKAMPYFLDKHPGITKSSREYRDIINLAKEDARYILPLSTLTQAGMTLNARSLEKMIRRLLADDLAECREMGNKIYLAAEGHAPSLIKYTKPSEYETGTYNAIKKAAGSTPSLHENEEVSLIKIDQDMESDILAALLQKVSSLDLGSAKNEVSKWDAAKKEKIFDEATKDLSSYDPVLREFEVSDIDFNVLISASCFAQLKRHRMATIIDGQYSPSLGVKIPLSIIETDQKNYFMEMTGKANDLYDEAKKRWDAASDYILTNAHRKNVAVKCNFRELVHISRMRSDIHAQWDIRNISDKMIELVKPRLPLIGKLLGGKDRFTCADPSD